MKCVVPDCPRTDTAICLVWVGGARVTVATCPPHGAEYRIDEAHDRAVVRPVR